jgi:NADH dehydrogenase [ubiquinone] 1 alpha subcomplex assembly factor 2
VGYDLAGNAYYELPGAFGRSKRVVEYVDKSADYRRGTAQLPVQWTAWLSFTRNTPPSLAELQADANRRVRLGPLVAAIEARERAERIQQGYLLPDGSEVPRDGSVSVAAPPTPPYPLDVPVEEPLLAPPREKVNPAQVDSAQELRRLAEEDTRRRMAESGVAEPVAPPAAQSVQPAAGLKPRRRG